MHRKRETEMLQPLSNDERLALTVLAMVMPEQPELTKLVWKRDGPGRWRQVPNLEVLLDRGCYFLIRSILAGSYKPLEFAEPTPAPMPAALKAALVKKI